MTNSVSGLSQAGLYTMLEVSKNFDKTATPIDMSPPEPPEVVRLTREMLQQAKNDLKSGNYYPGKYLNILA